uniref:Ferredoxin n=1 Tax=Gracilaria ferox TaxID=1184158 RepID=A0A345U7E6_9FLOR|nr:ferredoxin [Gracilaria ferox]AXI96382.1 ferredoxin [Gracilaria ferox]UAD85866.1 ferredoxin [Gracilaria ferox]
MSYKITLQFPDETVKDVVINCNDDQTVVDAAEEMGVDLPYSCRAGACSTCAGKIISGNLEQDDQTFLDDDQIADNFVLTCVAIPKSDSTILVGQEDSLY